MEIRFARINKAGPAWLDRHEYPFASKYIDINGVKMHYIDQGYGDPLFFVHGTPSWSFEYRNLIKVLSKSHRCVAFDHIGFGLSDKPANYQYSTQRHSENMSLLIEELGLECITLVVHDFGGPIGLNYAILNPGKIEQLIIFNTWMWSSEGDPQFEKIRKILKSPVVPFLYRYLNFPARFLLARTYADKSKLTGKIKRHYTRPFGKPSERGGTTGFALSLINDQQWFEDLWNRSERIEKKRTLIIWGMADRVIPPGYLERFERKFVNNLIIRLKDAGHFPQEEEPGVVIAEIVKWLEH